MINFIKVHCRRLHDVAKLLLCPQLIEELLLKQNTQKLEVSDFLPFSFLAHFEHWNTAIIDILINIDLRLLINRFGSQFDTTFFVDQAWIYSLEV